MSKSKSGGNGWEWFLPCSECGVPAGFACHTPGGRKRNTAHDTRPFVIPPLPEPTRQTALENELLEHLKTRAEFFKNPIDQFLLEQGQFYRVKKLPITLKRDKPQQCFANAGRRTLYSKELSYVEGYALRRNLIPIHHAWCVNDYGYVIDLTWEDPEKCVYYGVKIDRVTHVQEVFKNKVWGVFYPFEMANVAFIEELQKSKPAA